MLHIKFLYKNHKYLYEENIKYDIINIDIIIWKYKCKGDRKMGFKDTLAKMYADTYLQKYGDRLTQIQGHILSVKVTAKAVLWIFHKLIVDVVIKPERSKAIIRCQYKKNRWFKKPEFIQLSQGNLVLVQGMKGKKGKQDREIITIMNVKNFTTKQDLVKTDQKIQKVQQRQFIK